MKKYKKVCFEEKDNDKLIIRMEKEFPWLKDAYFIDANISVSPSFDDPDLVSPSYSLHWHGGIWINGLWKDGYWHKGIWKDGVWLNGHWLNGTWCNGVWINGFWEHGTFKNGIWCDGKWKSGIWENGIKYF